MTWYKSLFALAIAAAVTHMTATAAAYEADDDYLDVHFAFNQWAAVKTPGNPQIVICDGVFRYWPALEPRPVCEEKSKAPGMPNYEPARFVQLSDWLEENGYQQPSFIDIDDDYTLKLSIDKAKTGSLEGAEYLDYFGHLPGFIFMGVGGVESGSIKPKRQP